MDMIDAFTMNQVIERNAELVKQRAELLEALRMVQEAAIDMRGEDFNLTTEQWSAFHAAITKAEASE